MLQMTMGSHVPDASALYEGYTLEENYILINGNCTAKAAATNDPCNDWYSKVGGYRKGMCRCELERHCRFRRFTDHLKIGCEDPS